MVVLFVKMQQRCKHVRNLEAGAVCRSHFPLVLIEEVSPLMYKDGS